MARRPFLSPCLYRFLATLCLAILLMGGSGWHALAEPLKAVVTVGMVADVVRHVGGERVEVTTLMGAGVDPHSYRQTRSDVSLLARADIIFASGLNLEAQLDPLLRELGERKSVVFVADRLPESDLRPAEGFSGRHDPHVWMDPNRWVGTVNVVRDALIVVDPEGAAVFTANAAAYEAEIVALAGKVGAMLATIAKPQRVLFTAHDAFGYFGEAFDIEVLGIQGLSTESEAGLRQIETMVSELVSRDVKAVFVESSVSEKNIRALIEGAAAQGKSVAIGGTLYSDAMGQDGTFEGTYMGMIDHNATTITRALGGIAPERGVTGSLTPQS